MRLFVIYLKNYNLKYFCICDFARKNIYELAGLKGGYIEY